MDYYANPKQRLIGTMLGPVFDVMESHGVSGAFFVLALYTVFLYFNVLRKKPKRYTWLQKYKIGVWFFMLLASVYFQILLMTIFKNQR